MIVTQGDFVSDVKNSLKALNKDDHVSARYVLSLAHPYVSYLINNRALFRFFRDKNLFTTATCVEMKRIKSYDCCVAEFRNCDQIMQSKSEIPKILSTRFGAAIEFVTNIVNGESYEPLRNVVDFINSKKRQFGNNFKYYYIDGNNHLYLLNSTAELVNISAAFLQQDELKKISACKDESDDDDCKSKLDNKFVCPEEYLSSVKEQVLNILLNRSRVIQDTKPDLDENQKSRTN